MTQSCCKTRLEVYIAIRRYIAHAKTISVTKAARHKVQ